MAIEKERNEIRNYVPNTPVIGMEEKKPISGASDSMVEEVKDEVEDEDTNEGREDGEYVDNNTLNDEESVVDMMEELDESQESL